MQFHTCQGKSDLLGLLKRLSLQDRNGAFFSFRGSRNPSDTLSSLLFHFLDETLKADSAKDPTQGPLSGLAHEALTSQNWLKGVLLGSDKSLCPKQQPESCNSSSRPFLRTPPSTILSLLPHSLQFLTYCSKQQRSSLLDQSWVSVNMTNT